MKKIMIAAAIVCVAALSQAASFQWKTSSTLTDMAGKALTYDVTLEVFWVKDGSTAISPKVSEGTWTVKNGTQSDAVSFTDDNFTVNNIQKFIFVYKDQAGNTFTSKEFGSKAQSTSTPTLAFSMTSGNWEKAPEEPTPTPEPTSAILMVVGMAGLALRRRRA